MGKAITLSKLIDGLAAPLLLFPALFTLAAFIVIPSAYLLVLSATNYSPGLDYEFVGLDNYVALIFDNKFVEALLRNALFVFVVVTSEISIGFGIALLLQYPFPLRRLWLALLLTPFAISPIVAVAMWKYMLDPSFGIVSYYMSAIGLPTIAWLTDGPTSMAAIIVVAVWKDFAFCTIVMYAALSTVPKELIEAAMIDGTTPFQRFRHVTLPLVLPALTVVALFRVIYALREFGVPWTMTKGGPGSSTEILSIYLYRQAFGFADYGMGAAIGWLMLAFTLLSSIYLVRRAYHGMFPDR